MQIAGRNAVRARHMLRVGVGRINPRANSLACRPDCEFLNRLPIDHGANMIEQSSALVKSLNKNGFFPHGTVHQRFDDVSYELRPGPNVGAASRMLVVPGDKCWFDIRKLWKRSILHIREELSDGNDFAFLVETVGLKVAQRGDQLAVRSGIDRIDFPGNPSGVEQLKDRGSAQASVTFGCGMGKALGCGCHCVKSNDLGLERRRRVEAIGGSKLCGQPVRPGQIVAGVETHRAHAATIRIAVGNCMQTRGVHESIQQERTVRRVEAIHVTPALQPGRGGVEDAACREMEVGHRRAIVREIAEGAFQIVGVATQKKRR